MHPNFQPLSQHLYRWQSCQTGPHHPVNSYALLRQEGTVLIDPAADLTPSVLEPLRAKPVIAILITHLQEENAAGVCEFPGVPVYVPSGDEYLCEGLTAYRDGITTWPAPWDWETRGNFQGHLAGAPNERPLPDPIQVAGVLTAGQLIHGLRVVPTPGHGKHAISLVGQIDGTTIAFCGDLAHAGGTLFNWFDSEWDYGLQHGIRTLRASLDALLKLRPTRICPTHGPMIDDPDKQLGLLGKRIDDILAPLADETWQETDTTCPATPSGADRWWEVLPGLYQWRPDGNGAVLVSSTGAALMVDDGLCEWIGLDERARHHREAITQLKRAVGIGRIEVVVPTHYHGDHIENIPDLVELESSSVVCLNLVADPIEHPERYDLCSLLPWYGTRHRTLNIDHRVASGYRLRWHEYDLEIFHLGGQTWYHSGIQVTIGGRRVVFVGDSLTNTADCPPMVCYNDCEPQTRGWAYAIDRLLQRSPDLLICGHGDAIASPMPLLHAARRNWDIRLAQYRAISARADLRFFLDPFISADAGIPATVGVWS